VTSMMTRKEYHDLRRARFRLTNNGSSNDIGYSQYEADNNRAIARDIERRIRPSVDRVEEDRRWRLARLQNELRYFVRFGKKPKERRQWSIWP
jgi:hypothetical protein